MVKKDIRRRKPAGISKLYPSIILTDDRMIFLRYRYDYLTALLQILQRVHVAHKGSPRSSPSEM